MAPPPPLPPRSPDTDRNWSSNSNSWSDRQPPPHLPPRASGRTTLRNDAYPVQHVPPQHSHQSSSLYGATVNPYAVNAGPSRRSGSPDNERSRQNSAGGLVRDRDRDRDRDRSYRTDTYIPSDDIEPGQIPSPILNYQPQPIDPRDSRPIFIPTGPSVIRPNQPMPYRPARKVSSDRPNDGARSPLAIPPGTSSSSSRDTLQPSSGSVMGALENFSKAMHTALVTTSQHSLALKHFSRLSTFPHTNPTSVAFEDAQKRVSQAERALNDQMIALQSSFTELIRRTINKTGNSLEAISALEIDGLKERMRKLEEIDSRILKQPENVEQPPPPPVRDVPPPPPLDECTAEGSTTVSVDQDIDVEMKKRKVGAVLDDIIARLDKCESMKDDFDFRIDTVETELMTKDSDFMDNEARRKQMREYSGWSGLENRRDPNGAIRGLKRKERDVDAGELDVEIESKSSRVRPNNDSIAMSDDGVNEKLVGRMQKEIARLSEEMGSIKSQIATSAATPTVPITPNVATACLQNMMGQLRYQRLSITSDQQSDKPVDWNEVSNLKDEFAKLAEQMKQLESSARRNTSISGSTNGSSTDLSSILNALNALRSDMAQLTNEVKGLLVDKTSRSGVFQQISSGVQSLAETIKQCRLDCSTVNEVQVSSSATIIIHTEEIKSLRNDFVLLRAALTTISQTITQKDQEMNELKKAVGLLQGDLKELRDGRESWTREVMAACLDLVKEETENGKEDYAKIAKREIQNFVKDFMAKRSSSTINPNHDNRSTSEPADNSDTPPLPRSTTFLNPSPALPPQSQGQAQTAQPNVSSHLAPAQPSIVSRLTLNLDNGIPNQTHQSNPLASRINPNSTSNPGSNTSSPQLAPSGITTETRPAPNPKPTLSARMSGNSTEHLQAQSQSPHGLAARLTGLSPTKPAGDGGLQDGMDIDNE
ncbi:uncharacterized protein IL334_007469 [Kwoniella shivajii]|uniref:Actin interacting protein 3 C-terminal domain-containing protein n=1 Tax=Kwoniella shivajii TaxID=564305 RepID=A0ABZ1D9J6_9TREE|nr:hypothetical protein IL334_007469 [Kwoniella shivajii]